MYICNICGIEKEDYEFYKAKSILGHDKTCKECRKVKVKKYREDNIEKVKEYDRNRPNHKERIEQCKNRYKQKRLEGDESFLEKDRDRIRKYRNDNPDIYQAHNCVNNALREGKLYRPDTCECCGKICKPQAHHWSYKEEYWLDVKWLCARCHADEHKRLNEEKRNL